MKQGFTILSILLLCGVSCIDEIALDIDRNEPILAIQGLITDSLDNYNIRVHYSAPLGVGSDNLFEPIPNAQVRVYDDAGNSFEFHETEPGIYEREMRGQYGRSYYAEIITPDNKIIRSKPAVITNAPSIDSITAEVTEETSLSSQGNIVVDTRLILKMHTTFHDPEDKPFLRWRALGEFEFWENYPTALNKKVCYVKNSLDFNNLRIFDTRTLSGNRISDEIFINTPLDYRFAHQYCFHIKQYSLTEDEYIYWDAVHDIINIDGSLFDPPPGTVRGNLYNMNDPNEIIAGYFSVCGVKSIRFFANPQSLNQVHIEPKCAGRFGRPFTPDCYDCTTIHNSTLIRPEYWQF